MGIEESPGEHFAYPLFCSDDTSGLFRHRLFATALAAVLEKKLLIRQHPTHSPIALLLFRCFLPARAYATLIHFF
jgi:hypothetical protein